MGAAQPEPLSPFARGKCPGIAAVNEPLITVGIPCYNAGDTIARAIASARAQTWSRLEIVVVDDASTDATVAAVEKARGDDSRVRFLRHKHNRGPGAARQTILDEARGEFIAFFDDDDESAPERVAVQYERLNRYVRGAGPAGAACYASGERVYGNGYRKELSAIGSRPLIPAGEDVIDYLLFNRRRRGVFYGAGTPACALMAATQSMRDAGGFDAALRRVEDVDLAIRMAARGAHFIGCPEKLFLQHATHAPDKSAKRNYEAEVALMEKNRAYLERKHRYDFARRWFKVRYHHFAGERRAMLGALAACALRHPLLVTRQLLTTVPERFLHERRLAPRSS
jgi:glycosyltransferase involved in cell wall biosynthesis